MRLFFLFCLLSLRFLCSEPPEAYFVTWDNHPESTAIITWLAKGKPEQELQFHKKGADAWQNVKVKGEPFSLLPDYLLFKAPLEDLDPETLYEFSLPEGRKLYSFSTLPKELNHPLKFITGGDIYHDAIQSVVEMNRVAAVQDPDFVLLGGDLAYAGSRFSFLSENGDRWLRFLKVWSYTMEKSDGSLIPLIAAIGNHEVNGSFDKTSDKAKGFYQLFLSSGPSYRAVDIGSYMTLWILDSGHTQPFEIQAEWLESSLKEREAKPYKFALYHVPAYPSVRAFDNKRSVKVRQFFVPLFEKYKLNAAFENHDHTYKRSHLIKEGKVDPEGVLYMGDGSWGAEPRKPRTEKESWYIAQSAASKHVLQVTLYKDKIQYHALGPNGVIIDSYEQ